MMQLQLHHAAHVTAAASASKQCKKTKRGLLDAFEIGPKEGGFDQSKHMSSTIDDSYTVGDKDLEDRISPSDWK